MEKIPRNKHIIFVMAICLSNVQRETIRAVQSSSSSDWTNDHMDLLTNYIELWTTE